MKLHLNTKQLSEKLNTFSGIIGKSIVPILSNVLVEVDNKHIKLTGDNLETRRSSLLPHNIEVTENYSTCVPYSLLQSIIKGFPDAAVVLDFQEKTLHITCGKSQYELPLYKPDEFATPKEPKETSQITVNSAALAESISEAAKFTSNDELGGFNKIIFTNKDNALAVAGISGAMMYENKIESTGADGQLQLLVHTAQQLVDFLKFDDEVSITYSESILQLTSGDDSISLVQANGRVVNYTAVFDQFIGNADKSFSCDASSLIASLKRISPLVHNSWLCANFTIAPGNLTILYNNTDSSYKAEESVSIDYDGEKNVIGLNPRFLLPIVTMMGDTFTMRFKGPKHATVYQKGNKRCLLMVSVVR